MLKAKSTAHNLRLVTLLLGVLLTAGLILQTGEMAKADEPSDGSAGLPVISDIGEATIDFDINDRRAHTAEYQLEDGTIVEVGASPAAPISSGEFASLAALNGTWNVWGDNGLARMEYKVAYQPVSSGSNYTRAASAYGLNVIIRLGTFEGEKLTIIRASETSSFPSIVEGSAKFYYAGVLQQSGGVRATVKDGNFSATLY